MTDPADTFAWLLDRARTHEANRKPVYLTVNPVGQARPAWMRPATWLHPSLYADFPTPRAAGDTSPLNIALENLIQLARTCRDGGVIEVRSADLTVVVASYAVTAGAPVIFDWEGFYQEPNFATFATYIRTFRDAAPSVPVGYCGPHWLGGATLNDIAASTATPRRIIDLADILCPQCYPDDPASIDRSVMALRSDLRLTKVLYPNHLVIPIVTHAYVRERADDWTPENEKMREVGPEGRPLVEMCYEEGKGMMAWGGRDRLVEVVGPVVVGTSSEGSGRRATPPHR
jgi:hypothetical protein